MTAMFRRFLQHIMDQTVSACLLGVLDVGRWSSKNVWMAGGSIAKTQSWYGVEKFELECLHIPQSSNMYGVTSTQITHHTIVAGAGQVSWHWPGHTQARQGIPRVRGVYAEV